MKNIKIFAINKKGDIELISESNKKTRKETDSVDSISEFLNNIKKETEAVRKKISSIQEKKKESIKDFFPQDLLVSTRGFNNIINVFCTMESVHGGKENNIKLKEFKKDLLKTERNNFNRLIDKELLKIEKGE